MITDNQVKKLRSTFMNPKFTVQTSALKANVCENTAHKYLQKENRLPSEIIAERPPREYLTRASPFDDIYGSFQIGFALILIYMKKYFLKRAAKEN